jgi:tetratricopeptide (TPR) repeat protein
MPHPCAEIPRVLPDLTRAQVGAQFQACLRLAPDDTRLHAAFAAYLQETGEPAAALPLLHAWLRREPGSLAAHNLIGIVQSDLGDFPAAIRQFRRAVRLAPDCAAGWANLGMLLKTVGQFAQALQAYDAALEHFHPDWKYPA